MAAILNFVFAPGDNSSSRNGFCSPEPLLRVSRTALAVPTALAQGPTAVRPIVNAPRGQIVYRNITYTEANGQPEQLDVYVPKGIRRSADGR